MEAQPRGPRDEKRERWVQQQLKKHPLPEQSAKENRCSRDDLDFDLSKRSWEREKYYWLERRRAAYVFFVLNTE